MLRSTCDTAAQSAVEVGETGGGGGDGGADGGDDVDDEEMDEVKSMMGDKDKLLSFQVEAVCIIFIDQWHSSIVEKFENRRFPLAELH